MAVSHLWLLWGELTAVAGDMTGKSTCFTRPFILLPLFKVREGEQPWQLSDMEVLQSVQVGL